MISCIDNSIVEYPSEERDKSKELTRYYSAAKLILLSAALFVQILLRILLGYYSERSRLPGVITFTATAADEYKAPNIRVFGANNYLNVELISPG